MARTMIDKFTKEGDLILDPFVGSGCIALECLIARRSVICFDTNPYAVLLTKAKLFPPESMDLALKRANKYLTLAMINKTNIDLSPVPKEVKDFFHPQTLTEILALTQVLKENNEDFLLACLMGILHHQRPGFLSYPASHAVPYLRTQSFPKEKYPELYQYRAVKERFLKKIVRTYKRFPIIDNKLSRDCYLKDSTTLKLSKNSIDAVITSPPYMNALDYVRDNRLRLWFLGDLSNKLILKEEPMNREKFESLMKQSLTVMHDALKSDKKCIFVTGEVCRSKTSVNTAEIITEIAHERGDFDKETVLEDIIPLDRRIRKSARCVRREWVVVLRKK